MGTLTRQIFHVNSFSKVQSSVTFHMEVILLYRIINATYCDTDKHSLMISQRLLHSFSVEALNQDKYHYLLKTPCRKCNIKIKSPQSVTSSLYHYVERDISLRIPITSDLYFTLSPSVKTQESSNYHYILIPVAGCIC